MRLALGILLALCLTSCGSNPSSYNSKGLILPDAPSVQGAGKITSIPKNLSQLDKKQTNDLILRLSNSEIVNAKGYNARGAAWKRVQSIYRNSK